MKTIVYIDGQNFLYKIAEILINANLISDKQDIVSLNIAELLSPFFVKNETEIRYYGVRKISHGSNPDAEIAEKAKRFSDNLRKFKNYITKDGIIYTPKGNLKARTGEPCKQCGYIDRHFQEKGVDVGIAIDLVRDVMLKKCKNVALFSSDTDLLPALQIAKQENVRVTYIAFAGRTTISLSKVADKVVIIKNKAVCEAYVNSLNSK